MEQMNPVWSPRIIQKSNGGERPVYFEVISFFKPSPKDLKYAQADLGYHPKGYGDPYIYFQEETKPGMWITKWSCAGSCD